MRDEYALHRLDAVAGLATLERERPRFGRDRGVEVLRYLRLPGLAGGTTLVMVVAPLANRELRPLVRSD